MPQPICYLNTDLDLVADCDLSPLTQTLEARGIYPLHVTWCDDGLSYSVLERSTFTDDATDSPEVTITAMLDAIESLDESVRAIWTACRLREFNIAYDCGNEPWAFNNGLTNLTLQRIAQAGASLRITLYPERPTIEVG